MANIGRIDGSDPRYAIGDIDILAAIRYIFVVLILLKYTGIRDWPHVYEGEIYVVSKPVKYLEAMVSLAAVATLIAHFARPNLVFASFRNSKLMIAFLLFSIGHAVAFSSDKYQAATYAFGYVEIFIALSLLLFLDGRRRFFELFCIFGLFYVAVNLASVAVPGRSFMIGLKLGSFRGLTQHRNDLSYYCVTFLVIAYYARSYVSSWIRVLVMSGAIVLIALTGSAQGFILLITCLLVGASIRYRSSIFRPLPLVFISVSVAVLYILAGGVDGMDEVLKLFGRDMTFSNRDRIWRLSLYMINNMPSPGYGFGSVGNTSVPMDVLKKFRLGSTFGTAHDSYLEAILTYGYLGAALFFAVVAREAARLLPVFRLRVPPPDALGAVLLTTCLIGGITASEKLFLPGFGWLTFVLGSFLLRIGPGDFAPRSPRTERPIARPRVRKIPAPSAPPK